MKRITIIIALALLSMIYISSCSKDDDVSQNKNNTTTMNNARLNNEMTNEEMEADINAFIDKLDEPNSYPDMNFEEAFEYVEATLNYKYVNYDYSKCANTQEFSGSVSISVNSDNEMSMTEISEAYNSILSDWQSNYYSVEDTVKTPIVFDITDVTSSSIKYTMIVGYGELDLSEWGDEFVTPPSTNFFLASVLYNNRLHNHLNNNMIQWLPSGRLYIPNVIVIQYLNPLDFISYANDPYPPNNNGFTDYKYFYSHLSNSNHHLDFDAVEFDFYYDQLYIAMTNYLYNHSNVNYIGHAKIMPSGSGTPPNYYMALHRFKFHCGYSYWSLTNVSTL